MGIVTEYFIQILQQQVNERGIVVWFDPDSIYIELAGRIEIPDAQQLRFDGSYLRLRRAMDDLMNDIQREIPPRLLIYLPFERTQAGHILDEFIFGGTIIQPGEPIPRNTSLEVVARQALRTVFSREKLEDICTEIGKGLIRSLDELDRLAEQGSSNALALIFGTTQIQEIAFQFLINPSRDKEIVAKMALKSVGELLAESFGGSFPDDETPAQLRERLQKHLLITEFRLRLAGNIPDSLDSVLFPKNPLQQEACLGLVGNWRNRRDVQQNYIITSHRVESEFGISGWTLDLDNLREVHTFAATEEQLQNSLEEALLAHPSVELTGLAKTRRSGFWSMADERIGTRWALAATAGQVLLLSASIQNILKSNPPANVVDYIEHYTDADQGWCLLDTYQRTLERLAVTIDFDPLERHSSLELLLVRARQDYIHVVDQLAQRFISTLSEEKFETGNVVRQREIFSRYVAPLLKEKKTAYFLVDALRFEMARDLMMSLGKEWKADLVPAVATPPTITPVGMAALLPGAEKGIDLINTGELAVEVGGWTLKDRKDRISYLNKNLDDFYEIKLEALVPSKKSTRDEVRKAKFILVTSQEIDLLGEGDNIIQAREFMDSALSKLARAFRLLSDLGVERIIVSADHGYIFCEELDSDLTIPAPGGETIDLHRRVWVGRGGQILYNVLRVPCREMNLGGDFEIATPLGIACFATSGGKAYFHGGLSLQELIIPVLVLQPVALARVAQIDWQFIPGREKITTRFFSVLIQGQMVGLFDVEPPRVRVEIRAGGKLISTPVSTTYGFLEATGEIQLRQKADKPQELEPNTVALMITSEITQKGVSVLLIDAETDQTLRKFDIEIAIAI